MDLSRRGETNTIAHNKKKPVSRSALFTILPTFDAGFGEDILTLAILAVTQAAVTQA
jgi:hypothetical protein